MFLRESWRPFRWTAAIIFGIRFDSSSQLSQFVPIPFHPVPVLLPQYFLEQVRLHEFWRSLVDDIIIRGSFREYVFPPLLRDDVRRDLRRARRKMIFPQPLPHLPDALLLRVEMSTLTHLLVCVR